MDDATRDEVRALIRTEVRRLEAVLLKVAEGMGKTMRSAIAKSEGSGLDLLGELEQRIARVERALRDGS